VVSCGWWVVKKKEEKRNEEVAMTNAKEHLSEIQKGGTRFYRMGVRRAIHLEDSVAATQPRGHFVQPLQGCKPFVNFTTGFGLRPAPAAIIVMTHSGSGKEKWRARPALLKNPPILHRGLRTCGAKQHPT
jgi:hypothetical protein